MNELSLKAQKAVAAGEQRRRAYWPSLSKTENLLILERPHRFRKGGRKAFADYVYQQLSLFGFNSRLNRWEGPLTWEAYSQIVDKFTQAKELQVRLSDEVRIWADCAKFAKEMHAEIAAAGGEPAYSCGVNAEHYRQKAAKYRGKLRQYYLRLALECEKRRRQWLSQKDDQGLSCSEWCEKYGKPCGGYKVGCRHCPVEE